MAATVEALVEGYLKSVVALTAARGLEPLILVPPAPNIKLRKIPSYDRELFSQIVHHYCETLSKAAGARGLPVVDLYAASVDPEGGVQSKLYIDGNHVLPSAYQSAFEQLAASEP